MRIVAVDNNLNDLTLLEQCLREVYPGSEIITFTNPMSAVQYEMNNTVDMVFTEVLMHKISGLDVARLMLKFRPSIAIHFVTQSKEYLNIVQEYRPTGYYVKPITATMLRQAATSISPQNRVKAQ